MPGLGLDSFPSFPANAPQLALQFRCNTSHLPARIAMLGPRVGEDMSINIIIKDRKIIILLLLA